MEAGSQRDLLPIVDNAPPTPAARSRSRGVVLHVARLGIVVAIVWLIREQHREFVLEQASQEAVPIEIERLRKYYADIAEVGSTGVFDEAGTQLGYFVQTSPTSDHIVGFSGPTNTLIAFDSDSRVIGIDILDSRDTPEHVADVRRNDVFMTALAGKAWNEFGSTTTVDAVSGATLTSLAILEGISFRVGGTKPSLKFPDEIEVGEVTTFFPDAASLQLRRSSATLLDVYDKNDLVIGAVTRTAPTTDTIMGYQGPTDSLLAFDREGDVIGLQLRKSYDNEPYVGYVRDETYFLERFNGLTLQELAKIDIDELQVEGVSGATMTSMAIADGLPKAALAALKPPPPTDRRFVFAARDVGTLLVLVTAMAMSFSRLRSYRSVRITFQLTLVGYFGFVNGDMLSQALLVGWAQSGVPWRLAPGLLLVVAASLIVPAVSKKQLYCHHVCPFGAAQQLLRNRLPWRLSISRRFRALLGVIPATLLVVVLLTAMLHWPLNLAGIEAFDAFFFLQVVGLTSLAIALVGLIASAFVPMAYCRFGCPTGALLNQLRYNAQSARFTRRDSVAIALLAIAFAIWLGGQLDTETVLRVLSTVSR
ncbi:MAG: FMN-binding protein [Planctomycetes bacterium]|nr:FMN-binding protein [Planctomycetota bacterium]